MSRTTRGLGAMRPEQANRDQPEAQQGGSGCGCFLTILVIVGAVIGVSFAAERYDFPGADLFRTTNSKAEQWYWQVGQFLFDNEAEPTLADGSVTTPTPPPPTAAPIVIRATATPAPTLTRSGPVSSVSTAPVQTSAARLPYTPVPAPTYTSRPTVTPWPSRTPTPWLTPTPAWRPPAPQELEPILITGGNVQAHWGTRS